MPVFPLGGAKLRRSFSLAIKSLWLHKLRSFLSVFGIIIGTWSVISLMAFGEGSMNQALEAIKQQGATNIIIRSVKPPDDSATASKGWVTAYGLVNADMRRFETLGNAISRVVPMRIFPTEARYLDRLANTRVIGTVPDYAVVNKLVMARGRFLMGADDAHSGGDDEPANTNMDDNRQLLNVCVLGSEAADKLFPFEDPIDKMVQMKSMRFLVVGVVQHRMPTGGSGGSQAAEDYNRDIYIPFKTSTARFGSIISVRTAGARMNEQVDISQVTMTVNAEVDRPEGRKKVQAVGNEIKRMLEQYHYKQDYAITIPLDKLEEAEKSQNRFTALLGSIAVISLVVGGIGIMNIMLATVTERTREIGIRRALGAKRKDIIMQFLVEAIVQTSVGGLFGVVFGLGTIFTVPPVWEWLAKNPFFAERLPSATLPANVNVPSLFLSVGLSIFIGVVFGLYPAWRAAKLDPIEALRHD